MSSRTPETITITDAQGKDWKCDVQYTDDSVITTHQEGNQTTIIEVILSTGEVIEHTFENGVCISSKTEINKDIQNSNRLETVKPFFVFPTEYQNIGSLTYNQNDTGVEYLIAVQCRDMKEERVLRYNLNKNSTQLLQTILSAVISLWKPSIKIEKLSKFAETMVNKLIDLGILNWVSATEVEAVTSDYIDGFVTTYDMKCTSQFGVSTTNQGTAVYVTSEGNRYHQTFFYDLYPQFIEQQDVSVASMVYSRFDSYGFPGVKTWNATQTVSYAKEG